MKNSYISPLNLIYRDIEIEESIFRHLDVTNCNLNETAIVHNNYNILSSLKNGLILRKDTTPDIKIPLSILKNHSTLEAIVYYLHAIHFLRYSEIALILNRDQRTIWNCYNKAKNKITIKGCEEDISLPINIFYNRTLSMLESVVFNLRTVQGLTIMEISQKLGKNYRTIWTVYNRSLKKLCKCND